MVELYFAHDHVYVIDAVLIDAREQAFALLVAKLSSQSDRTLRGPVYEASVFVAPVDLLAHYDHIARRVVDHVLRSRAYRAEHVLLG